MQNRSWVFFHGTTAAMGQDLLIVEASRSPSVSRQDSSGRVIGSMHKTLPDNTRLSQQTDIHVPGGIPTHNPSKRLGADLHLRQHGCWNRRSWVLGNLIYEGAKLQSCGRSVCTSPYKTQRSQRINIASLPL